MQRLYGHVTTVNPHELRSVSGEHFTLAVLCHTLTLEQYQGCVEYIHARWREVQIMQMNAADGARESCPERTLSKHPISLLDDLKHVTAGSF